MYIRTVILLLLVVTFSYTGRAQEKFTGIVDYKVNEPENGKNPSVMQRMSVVHGTDKILLQVYFNIPALNASLLLDVKKDSVYRINPGAKTYTALSAYAREQSDINIKMLPANGTNTFLDHSCSAFDLLDTSDKKMATVWLAGDMNAMNKPYLNMLIRLFAGCGKIPLNIELVEGGEYSTITATAIFGIIDVPESYFDLSGYKREAKVSWPRPATATQKKPATKKKH